MTRTIAIAVRDLVLILAGLVVGFFATLVLGILIFMFCLHLLARMIW